MKIPKEKRRVNVVCNDNSLVVGFIHVDQGFRTLDFMNNLNQNFLPVTDATLYDVGEVQSFKLVKEAGRKRTTIILNKISIKWIEEVK